MSASYKAKAREVLMEKSPAIYITTLIYAILPVAVQFLVGKSVFGNGYWLFSFFDESHYHFFETLNFFQSSYLTILTVVLSIVFGLLDYGYEYYCLQASRGRDVTYADLFSGFNQPLRIIIANLIIGVKVFLWSLLLVIPGIIAAISYSQTYRILADNPDISASEAISRSVRIMYGHKGDWFILQLSFFWWYVLSSLTYSISSIYSEPYARCANSFFYEDISASAERFTY
ncbi:MAG: DUF975 family protein [Clostridiaceae bacterium]|nr:DUF975 family protein [Clostridiaceae bacterium]